MNRDEARKAFIAGVRSAGKMDHEGAFNQWWKQQGETAIELGTRIHQEAERELRVVAQLHDEILLDIPTENLTNGRAAYRCDYHACPERPPVRAEKAPKCYTCDRPMKVVAWAGDLMTNRAGEMIPEWGPSPITGVLKAKEEIARKVAKMMAMPGLLPIPLADPKLGVSWDAWIKARRSWRDDLHGKLDLNKFPMRQIPRERKDPAETLLDIAKGDALDQLAELVGIQRRPATFTDHETSAGTIRECVRSAEPDVELRERIRMGRLPQHMPPTAQAEVLVGGHPDVLKVRSEMRTNHDGEPQVFVEATLAPGKMTDALVRELDARLRTGLPVTLDFRLDVTYSQT